MADDISASPDCAVGQMGQKFGITGNGGSSTLNQYDDIPSDNLYLDPTPTSNAPDRPMSPRLGTPQSTGELVGLGREGLNFEGDNTTGNGDKSALNQYYEGIPNDNLYLDPTPTSPAPGRPMSLGDSRPQSMIGMTVSLSSRIHLNTHLFAIEGLGSELVCACFSPGKAKYAMQAGMTAAEHAGHISQVPEVVRVVLTQVKCPHGRLTAACRTRDTLRPTARIGFPPALRDMSRPRTWRSRKAPMCSCRLAPPRLMC